MTEPSAAYFEALDASKALHASTKKFNGRFFLRYVEDVKPIIEATGAKTMLDYGAGKGVQWETPLDDGRLLDAHLGVKVTKFDPAWPPFATEPKGKFDIVVCTQVLGSVPIADLSWVVDRLYKFARKAVYVGERLGPVRKQIHAHMAEQMPHGWTHEQWAEVLRRPGPVKGWLRTKDSESKDARLEALN